MKNKKKTAATVLIASIMVLAGTASLFGIHSEKMEDVGIGDPGNLTEAEFEYLLSAIEPHILNQMRVDPAFIGIEPAMKPIVVLLVATLAIFSAGVVFGYILAGPSAGGSAGSQQEEINAVLRQAEAQKIAWYGDGAVSLAASILPSNSTLWGFSQAHWNRAIELAVGQLWTYGQKYDPNLAVDASFMRLNMENLVYNWQAALDNAMRSMIDVINQFNDFPHLSQMTAQLVWDTGNAELRNSVMDFATLVTGGSAGQTVYIDAQIYTEGGTYNQITSGTLHNLTNSNIILRDIWTGSSTTAGLTVVLLPGPNDMSQLTYTGTQTQIRSGLYQIETNNSTFAGPLSMAADINAAEVQGTLIHRSTSYTWFTSDGISTFSNVPGQLPTLTHNLSLNLGYVDRYGNNAMESTIVVGTGTDSGQNPDLIAAWSGLIDRMNQTVVITARSGEVMWQIFDVTQESVPWLSPSSMITNIPGVYMTAQQAHMLALQQMVQIARIYEMFGDALFDGLNMVWNPQSLDTFIRGDIYQDNILMYQDIAFTPFSMLREQTFTVGGMTSWYGPGFVQIWGTGEIDDWYGPTPASQFQTAWLQDGFTIHVTQIRAGGEMVDSITLTPEVLKRYTVDTGTPPGPIVPPIIIESASDMVPIIIIMVSLLILGYAIGRGNTPAALIGLALLGLGLLILYIDDIISWFRSLLPWWMGGPR
ncbi:MAG: hypothetical protein FWD92_00015 [Methanomassiliicoccaceae archaeon]|nr:hypothetical protein [Methanomassiliicoccaceae archaeon]